MTLSLGRRIFAWSAASTVLVVVAMLLIVDRSFRTQVRADLEENLLSGAHLASEIRASWTSDRIARVSTLALDPVLRGTIDTRDSATVGQVLGSMLERSGFTWLAVISSDGSALAATAAFPAIETGPLARLAQSARFYDVADVWSAGGALLTVAASNLFFADVPLGVLVGGEPAGATTIAEMERYTQQRIVYLSEAGVVIASADIQLAAARQAFATQWSHGVSRPVEDPVRADAIQLIEIDGERFLAIGQPLEDAARTVVGELVVLRSLDAALAPARRLRTVLIGIAAVALALAAFFSSVLARSVTRPVNRLLSETVRLGSVDLDRPIETSRVDEIGRLARGFEQMRVSLRQARDELLRAERLSAVGRAASAIVHDFAQPVTVLSGHIDLLQGSDELERAESLDTMRKQIEGLRRMMQEILEYTRGESRITPVPCDVGALVDELARGMGPRLAGARIRLVVEHGFTGEWSMDSSRITRVLGNLVQNAAGAIEADGEITLRTSRVGDRLRIEVSDDGPGIPDAIRDTLFEPFVTSGKKGGTGLGLAIARNVLEKHGGIIDYSSSSRGTTFFIELPAHSETGPETQTEGPMRRLSLRARRAAALLTFLAASATEATAQLNVSGQVDLLAKAGRDRYGINAANRGDNPFNEFRVRVFAQHWVSERVGVFGEALLDSDADPHITGAYVVVNELAGKPWLNTKIGLAPALVGAFGQRSTYFNANPLIGVPLVWGYKTAMTGSGAITASELLQRKQDNARGLPALYDACWNIQWELLGEVGRFEYSIGATPGAASHPYARVDDGIQVHGRLGAEPLPGLRIGVSGVVGPYIGRRGEARERPTDFPGGPADYDQRLVGYDFEYSRGKVRIFSEGYINAWQAPLIAEDPSLRSAFLEARYNLRPAWYLAARVDAMTFSDLGPAATGTGNAEAWDDDVLRWEAALGYRFSREVLVRVDWQHTRFAGTETPQNMLAAQVSAVF